MEEYYLEEGIRLEWVQEIKNCSRDQLKYFYLANNLTELKHMVSSENFTGIVTSPDNDTSAMMPTSGNVTSGILISPNNATSGMVTLNNTAAGTVPTPNNVTSGTGNISLAVSLSDSSGLKLVLTDTLNSIGVQLIPVDSPHIDLITTIQSFLYSLHNFKASYLALYIRLVCSPYLYT